MQRQQISRIAGIVLALLTALVAAVIGGWASGADTPIVILDGSLTIESAVPWSQFRGSGDQRSHPNTGSAVTKVVVTVGGTDQTIAFNSEQCTVDITYANQNIKFTTGRNGKGLQFTPFGAFQKGDTPNRMAHKNQSQKISHVTVTKAGVKAFDADAHGGTKIVISYQ
jgi:hypothetical protein